MDKPRKTAKQLLDIKKQAGSFSVSANSTVKAALEVLSEKNVGAVLVMEGTKLVGIFRSATTLVRASFRAGPRAAPLSARS